MTTHLPGIVNNVIIDQYFKYAINEYKNKITLSYLSVDGKFSAISTNIPNSFNNRIKLLYPAWSSILEADEMTTISITCNTSSQSVVSFPNDINWYDQLVDEIYRNHERDCRLIDFRRFLVDSIKRDEVILDSMFYRNFLDGLIHDDVLCDVEFDLLSPI